MGSHIFLWASTYVLLDVQYMMSLYPVLCIQIDFMSKTWKIHLYDMSPASEVNKFIQDKLIHIHNYYGRFYGLLYGILHRLNTHDQVVLTTTQFKNLGFEYNNVYKYCWIYLKELFVSMNLTCHCQYMV